MSQVWGASGEDASFGSRRGKSPRELHSQYQKKELELDEERETLSKLQGAERQGRETLARIQRDREKKEAEALQLEQRQRDQERALQEAEHQLTAQKAKVSRLERDVNTLREQAFRRQSEE